MVGIEPGGEPDLGGGFLFKACDHQQRGGREFIGLAEAGAAAVGEAEAAGFAAALGDAVGEGGGEQGAGVAVGLGAGAEAFLVLAGALANAGECAAVGVCGAMGDGGEAQADIGAGDGAQRVAFFQQGGQFGGQGGFLRAAGGQHHRGQAGVGAELRHLAAGLGDTALGIECAEPCEQRLAGRERAGWRGVGERQACGRGTPAGAIQRQAGELGVKNFGAVIGGEAALEGYRPEAYCHPRRLTTRAAGALVGCGAADTQCFQPGESRPGIEPRRAAETAIHNNAHPRHGQRGLGDRGGKHHAPGLCRAQRPILLGRRQFAVQRQHQGTAIAECLLGATYFAHAGQEGEDVALVGCQGGADGAGAGLRQVARAGDVALGVLDVDGELAAGALDHRPVEQGLQARAVCGGRHREQAQFGAQAALQIQAEGQRQIGIQAALVHFIKNHARDAFEARIALETAHQQALGNHFDTRGERDGRVEPRAVADHLAHRLAEKTGHACGGGASSEAARFEHDNAPVAAPGLCQQGERHHRGLARTRRGDEHGVWFAA